MTTNNLLKRTLTNLRFQQIKKVFPMIMQDQRRNIVSDNNQPPSKTTHLERTNNLERQKVKFKCNVILYVCVYFFILIIHNFCFFLDKNSIKNYRDYTRNTNGQDI